MLRVRIARRRTVANGGQLTDRDLSGSAGEEPATPSAWFILSPGVISNVISKINRRLRELANSGASGGGG